MISYDTIVALAGRCPAGTVADIDGGHKNKLIAIRLCSTLDTRLDPCRAHIGERTS
jgi:hypothetical protein